ncbi:plastocyanin/azurin family copper-binding protein [Falsihalocynthiibacter sp. CO-5D18]|uniref:cupredoxin domain-containing protein n=1 Tax=Falsihalocynthiibacter sp. CO-5D18 TaxID=3240872 RepID=UPI00350F8EFA
MKNLLLATVASLSLAAPGFASGTHNDGHGEQLEIGVPGEAEQVSRTVKVSMKETDDGDMVFEPAELSFAKGETVRLEITNMGESEHEFVLDTVERNVTHKELMAKIDMEHDDPNSVRLDAGASGEIIWTFSNAGTFEFACLIPGHYESGMFGPVNVN